MLKIRSTSEEPRYRPYTITHQMRKLSPPVRINGKKAIRYPAPVITQYVDMVTGEIIDATALKNDPEFWSTVYFSERVLQRRFILAGLRKEVREFALFILAFRNQRRGVTPGVDGLVKWYAELTGKQACHVRRYLQPIEDAGVLVGSSLLGPLFQIAGSSTTASAHLGEDFRASGDFMLMLIKMQIEATLREAPQPRLTQERTVCTSAGKATVYAFLQSLISVGRLPAQFS
ncbi:MAG: hypothetical protein ACM34A_01755 [Bacillota bacterium]